MDSLAWWIAVSEIGRNFGTVLAGGIDLAFAGWRVLAANRQAKAQAQLRQAEAPLKQAELPLTLALR